MKKASREKPRADTPRKHPVRTCVGCRERADQGLLLRLVKIDSGGPAVVVDDHRRLAGRGAWLHPQPSCMELALKRKAFNRTFRGAVAVDSVEDRLRALKETSTGSRLKQTVLPESGSEN